MKRVTTALQVFIILLCRKDISLNLKYNKKEIALEQGSFAKTSSFLKDLQKRNNFPDYIVDQYKEVLNDFNYKS